MIQLSLASVEAELDDALALGGRALRLAEAAQQPALLSASLSGEALVLGRLQREDSLRQRSPARFDGRIARRHSSGTEAQLSGAVLYHALALPRVDTLFADAEARTLLNRNLRAILRGYTAVGVPLRYFGTEVLALLGHPVALVGYDQTASGAVLIEVLIGLAHPCVVRPALKREPPASLYQVLGRSPPPFELLQQAVRGIVERLGVIGVDVAGSLPLAVPVAELASASVPTSVPIPLGVVEAVTSPRVQITGDLLVGSAALASVEALAQAALDAGRPITEAVLEPLRGAALDGAKPADLLQALLRDAP